MVSLKFGALRDLAGGFVGQDNRLVSAKTSLPSRSGGSDWIASISSGRPRIDPEVPVDETLGAIAEMKQAGYVRHVDLSEVGAATLRSAVAAQPVADLKNDCLLLSRGIEAEIRPAAREPGIGITACGALSRGLLSGGRRRAPTSAP